jgi:RNA recognition motif-containing protein
MVILSIIKKILKKYHQVKCIDYLKDSQLKQHVEGKRHKKFESLKEEREKSAKRSLFISGLRKDTFVKQLEEHFIQFGKINKVIVDQEKVMLK